MEMPCHLRGRGVGEGRERIASEHRGEQAGSWEDRREGTYVGELDWTQNMDACCDWMGRHPEIRAAWGSPGRHRATL